MTQRYEVIAPMGTSISVGSVVALTEAQAHARVHALRRVAEGYEVTSAIALKRGEVFGLVRGDVAKAHLAEIAPSDRPLGTRRPEAVPALATGRGGKAARKAVAEERAAAPVEGAAVEAEPAA